MSAIREVEQGGAPPREVLAGAALYNPLVLAQYDAVVLGLSNRYAWGCPSSVLLDWYQQRVTANHLDVGVGTGYYLDRCRFPSAPRLVLADLNAHALRKAAHRIRRHHPTSYRLNVLAPFDLPEEPFDSIGMHYLLHCLPGDLPAKAIAFDHLLRLLRPNGILFGSTILGASPALGALGRAILALYNRLGFLSNRRDGLEGLERCLRARSPRVELRVVGSVALFSLRAPPRAAEGAGR